MTDLDELVDEVEADIGDASNTYVAAADILRWLRDAIKEISQYFPHTLSADIATSANDREYDLSVLFIEPTSVEYPAGEDPPEYLKRRPHTHQDFWSEDGYYDIVPRANDTDAYELYISTKPADSETITVTFTAAHDHTLASDAAITVPGKLHHILRLYARWQVSLFAAAQEELNPTSNSSLLMSQLAANTRRWERQYKNALAQAIQANYGRSQVTSWANQTDESTRIY